MGDIPDKESEPSLHFPFFTLIDTMVYLAALRVGQLYLNPLGNDDDNYEVVAFFNRNLRLARIYGLFGTTMSPGGFGDMPMPEMIDLGAVQDRCLPHIPVDFFADSNSNVGAFG